MHTTDHCFTPFKRKITPQELPKKFTFPFYYTPHTLCEEACQELMTFLEEEIDIDHNFGLQKNQSGMEIGKMFGILIVQNQEGVIGYLKAFSGKLANGNHHKGFVPPIFDMLDPNGFFLHGEEALNTLNDVIEKKEQQTEYINNKRRLSEVIANATIEINNQKTVMKAAKAARDQKRLLAKELSLTEKAQLEKTLISESTQHQRALKALQQKWEIITLQIETEINDWETSIQTLRTTRKEKSNQLQQQLFDQYNFLNSSGKSVNVRTIFEQTAFQNPPSGAGECATPKLLQYAFQHQLQPLAMAEFWWGASPTSEVRKHKHYYPACRGKCLPILNHMLDGIPMDDNPMLQQSNTTEALEIIYEDEHILVINKPAEFLSVPGIHTTHSVLSILQTKYPHATGPLLVHRLDMSTSGILIAAKTKAAHQNIQSQFIKKSIKKRYVAILNGICKEQHGIIDLPLRVDLNNRPFQVVCYEWGKAAKTKWEVIEQSNGCTRVYFYPITGRTHQLRVHAAHAQGLNIPIKGDDLYGIKDERLFLHAEYLEIKHPVSRELIAFECPPPF